MGLESATYIDGLNASNPAGADPKSQGDDHIRLLKSTIKATFPNVAGAVTVTHTELNSVTAKAAKGGDTYTGTHNFTAGTIQVATQSLTDNSTKAASTAYVNQKSFSTALPNQTGNAGKWVTTDGANASWQTITLDDVQDARGFAVAMAVTFGA